MSGFLRRLETARAHSPAQSYDILAASCSLVLSGNLSGLALSEGTQGGQSSLKLSGEQEPKADESTQHVGNMSHSDTNRQLESRERSWPSIGRVLEPPFPGCTKLCTCCPHSVASGLAPGLWLNSSYQAGRKQLYCHPRMECYGSYFFAFHFLPLI